MPFSLPLPRGYKYECLNGNPLNKHIHICACVLVYPYLGVFGYVRLWVQTTFGSTRDSAASAASNDQQRPKHLVIGQHRLTPTNSGQLRPTPVIIGQQRPTSSTNNGQYHRSATVNIIGHQRPISTANNGQHPRSQRSASAQEHPLSNFIFPTLE